jgi:hypothetical protein
MFKAGDFVSITGGAWQGRRGHVEVTPEQNEPTAVLVTVETVARGRGWNDEALCEYTQRWISPKHLAHLSAI